MTLEEAAARSSARHRCSSAARQHWFKPDDRAITWFQAGPEAVDKMEGTILKFLERV
jgi:hypothetical protein